MGAGSAGQYDGRHSNDEKSMPVEKPEVSEFKESCPPPGTVKKRLSKFDKGVKHISRIELFFVYKDPIFESQDMSTSNTHQQSLADAGSKTRTPMLERGLYEFRVFTPSDTKSPRMQKEEDLRGDDLKHCEAKIEAMNLILISIPNDIYNSVDFFALL
ncbi:hypothetical protein Tco_0830919 [Tanacetum coccineum]